MLKNIETLLSLLIVGFIGKFGLFAVLVLMTLESANVPIPSEVILTYAGFLASKGLLNFHLIALVGALGCVLGGSISYYIGMKLGRPFIYKYGKWFLVSIKDLERSEKFLAKYGQATYFISRLLPVVRTFIAFPVGIAKGNFLIFNLYSFLGSLIWSYILTWLGLKMGQNWIILKPYWDKFSYLVIAVILAGIIWHVYRVLSERKVKN